MLTLLADSIDRFSLIKCDDFENRRSHDVDVTGGDKYFRASVRSVGNALPSLHQNDCKKLLSSGLLMLRNLFSLNRIYV